MQRQGVWGQRRGSAGKWRRVTRETGVTQSSTPVSVAPSRLAGHRQGVALRTHVKAARGRGDILETAAGPRPDPIEARERLLPISLRTAGEAKLQAADPSTACPSTTPLPANKNTQTLGLYKPSQAPWGLQTPHQGGPFLRAGTTAHFCCSQEQEARRGLPSGTKQP